MSDRFRFDIFGLCTQGILPEFARSTLLNENTHFEYIGFERKSLKMRLDLMALLGRYLESVQNQ